LLSFDQQEEYLDKTFKKKYRFLQMMFCCFFVMGNYFCYDYPASLELQIEDKFNVSTTKYGLLYTGYAAPNLIMPLIGGVLSDKLGKRITLLIFCAFLVVGQGIFAMGGYRMSFNLMLVGRVVYGIGCESMYVGQSVILSEWFINYELQLAMGMASCIPLLGSFLGGAVVPTAYNDGGFGEAMLIGLLVCVFSFVCVMGTVILDFKMEQKDAIWLEEYTA
jgi:MFS family permease